MFDALARLADARGKWVVAAAIVFFVAAGAIGGSVADKLDPYGADDPDTETVEAQERLDDAGFRDASVIVLVEDVDATTPAGSRRVAEVAALVARGRRRREGRRASPRPARPTSSPSRATRPTSRSA